MGWCTPHTATSGASPCSHQAATKHPACTAQVPAERGLILQAPVLQVRLCAGICMSMSALAALLGATRAHPQRRLAAHAPFSVRTPHPNSSLDKLLQSIPMLLPVNTCPHMAGLSAHCCSPRPAGPAWLVARLGAGTGRAGGGLSVSLGPLALAQRCNIGLIGHDKLGQALNAVLASDHIRTSAQMSV